MRPPTSVGEENEEILVTRVETMQAEGFPLTMDGVRKIAHDIVKQLKLKDRFNKENQKAGYDWLQMFLSRNSDNILMKSEGVSMARVNAMNRSGVNAYFQLLKSILNLDGSGLQLNSHREHVLVEKGSKAISTVTSTEKGGSNNH
nr:uncharacterized protein LOC111516997 [Leptinotarsa decemlineata]